MFRSRRRGGRRARGSRFATRGQLRSEIQGSVPRGTFDPPVVVTSPWNSLVVSATSSFETSGYSQLKISDVIVAIQTQLGFNSTQKMYIRFSRLDVWTSVSDAVIGPLSFAIEPADLLSAHITRVTYRQWLEDIGTQARPAHCHYIWSRAEQQVVFASDSDGAIIILNIDHGANFSCYWHIHVLWRVYGGNPIGFRNTLTLTSVPPESDCSSDVSGVMVTL